MALALSTFAEFHGIDGPLDLPAPEACFEFIHRCAEAVEEPENP